MKREIIRVEGPCSAGCIAFSPLCICTGPVAQRSEVMRWKSLVYRSHLRRRACRREASIGCRPTTARKHAAPDSSAPQNPMMEKWLGYPGRLYNRRLEYDEYDRSEWQRGRLFRRAVGRCLRIRTGDQGR